MVPMNAKENRNGAFHEADKADVLVGQDARQRVPATCGSWHIFIGLVRG